MVAIGSGDGPPDLEAGDSPRRSLSMFYATIGVHPHDAAKATAETYRRLSELAVASEGRRHRRNRTGLSLRSFAPRRPARRIRRADAHRPRRAQAHRDPHALGLGRHRSHCCASIGRPADSAASSIAFPKARAKPRKRWRLGFHISFAGIVTFPKATAIQEAARITPPTACWWKPTRRFSRPSPSAASATNPPTSCETARKLAELRGVTAGGDRAQPPADNSDERFRLR